jgi:hypothetical protein
MPRPCDGVRHAHCYWLEWKFESVSGEREPPRHKAVASCFRTGPLFSSNRERPRRKAVASN